MKFVIAGTGASGAIYLQRLLAKTDARAHEVYLVLNAFAKQVIHEALGELRVREGLRSMNVSFVSGSAPIAPDVSTRARSRWRFAG